MQCGEDMDIDAWSMQDPRAQSAFRHFVNDCYDELVELYDIYMSSGTKLFGRAFHQTGSFYDFARYMFSNTHPGFCHCS